MNIVHADSAFACPLPSLNSQTCNRSTRDDLIRLPSITMSLSATPSSPQATTLIEALVGLIYPFGERKRKPSRQYVEAVGALIADLLSSLSYDPPRPCYRPLASGSFTSMAIGYHPTRRAIDDLVRAGLIDMITGDRSFGERPAYVTRIIPTAALASFVATMGVKPAARHAHFAYAMPQALTNPIRLKSGSKRGPTWNKIEGKPIPVDMSDPTINGLATPIIKINDYLAEQTFSMADRVALFRGFNCGDTDHKWKKGGRLFCHDGGYQMMKREDRPAILINGLSTAEVDISACHLTIVYALLKETLPAAEDIYAVAGIPRNVVKLFANYLLGGGKVPSRWTTYHGEKFDADNPKRLHNEFPIGTIAPVILQAHPILLKAIDANLNWADLQYQDSNVMIDAVYQLCIEEDICALPLHDSLIVDQGNIDRAVDVLTHSFHNRLGIRPFIKLKQ